MTGEAARGTVYLVGAGPGDPGLMTVRALELIASADVLLYDRLIPPGALDGARADAEAVYVGKQPGNAAMSQEDIGALLVEHGRAGRSVVRLKGGDPFVFGRGGEEAEVLAEAGVPFEVVPGVTAGVAAPAYAGIPVTHRDDASAVAFVTGHEDPEKLDEALDWDALAAFPGTLCLYMGLRNLPLIARRLVEAGRDSEQPAAAVERGTTPAQRTVSATLETLAAEVAEAGLKPPAMLVIGDVVRRRELISWVERRPLHGRRIVVTRARAQASELAARLRSLGADPIELPAIRIESLAGTAEVQRAAREIGAYELVCLTSPSGVEVMFEAIVTAGMDARALAGVEVAAVGPGTAAALERRGIMPDVVPERFVAEGLIEALAGTELKGSRVLVAAASAARETLPDALRERGAQVDAVSLYDTVPEAVDPEALAVAAEADYVTFTSSSTVTHLLANADGAPWKAKVVSIGPVTSATLREAGIAPDVEAERHDIDGLIEALTVDAGRLA